MLTPKPQLNLRNAKSYFREHLAVGDYYTEGLAVAGQWSGIGAAMLGLEGAVTEDEFLRLCDGLHPKPVESGKADQWLTARHNTHRRAEDGDGQVSNRRVFYDFTISPPKSVSVVALYQDVRIIAIHDAAARVMIEELEKFAETRVRRGGANSERVTGGVVGALFRHDTSRELDPHLHTHCILFNATYDQVENRWKALHATGMYRAQKFAENLYYHELAKGLRALGYQIENNARDFEIKGVPTDVISRFSKRHHQIDVETQRLIEAEKLKRADGEALNGHEQDARSVKSIKDLREQVAHDSRRRKIRKPPTEELRPHWELQMSPEERQALANLTTLPSEKSVAAATPAPAPARRLSVMDELRALQKAEAAAARQKAGVENPAPDVTGKPGASEKADIPAFLEWAQQHTFERKSVTTDYALLALALARGRGESFSVEELKTGLETAVQSKRYVRDTISPSSRKITSREALYREYCIVMAAREGRNRCAPLNARPAVLESPLAASLSGEKRHAVERILRSRDFITMFQGGAGTGKSFTLKEVFQGLKEKGYPIVVAAPQHQQAADLQRDGMEGASTLARVLAAGPGRLPLGAVVILDEAGQVGGKDMLALINAVRARKGRLILSGDTRQHGAVAAGDALRLLEKHTLLEPVRLKTIHRQDPDKVATVEEKHFVRQYRKAVEAASEGRLSDSFNTLETMGCVRELAPEERCETLAREYYAALERGEKVLVVAPTWDEVREANAAIRERLVAEGKLGNPPESKLENVAEGQAGGPMNPADAPDSVLSENSAPLENPARAQEREADAKLGVPINAWQSLDLSEAQKQDARFYPPDSKVVFVRKYGRFEKGDACEIAGFDEHGVKLRKVGYVAGQVPEQVTSVSFHQTNRFIVAKAHEIRVASGERLQMKFNGKSVEGTPIRNGELVTVRRVLADGRIVVCDDGGERKTLRPDQRLFVPGYAVTSYASQGKTVDTVLVSYAGADGTASALPVNRHQWYVAISRARKKVLVLTEDKEALRVRVEAEGNRESALSLVPDLVAEMDAKMPVETTLPVEPEAASQTVPEAETESVVKAASAKASPLSASAQSNLELVLRLQRQAMTEAFIAASKRTTASKHAAAAKASMKPKAARSSLLPSGTPSYRSRIASRASALVRSLFRRIVKPALKSGARPHLNPTQKPAPKPNRGFRL